MEKTEDIKRRNRFIVWFIFTLFFGACLFYVGYKLGYNTAKHEYLKLHPHLKNV